MPKFAKNMQKWCFRVPKNMHLCKKKEKFLWIMKKKRKKKR